MQRIDKPFV